MADIIGTAVLELSTDDSKMTKGLRSAQGNARRVGASMAKVGAGMSVALTAPIVAMARASATELGEIQYANQQTQAALRSTGGAANVTMRDITGLAGSLQKLSGMDDQAIQSGQNLLLTFTKIQNKAGEGNKIFDEASLAMVNMAARMKTDPTTAAMQLGKALNEPGKGYKRLARAGVQFTDAQGKQIEKMVESGKTLEAQKMILKELEVQFGGSAKAAGKTFPAQLAILKDSLAGAGASILQTFMPQIRQLIGTVQGLVAKFDQLSPRTKQLIGIFAGVAAAAGPLLIMVGGLVASFSVIGPVLGAIGGALAALVSPIGLVAIGVAALAAIWLKQPGNIEKVKAAVTRLAAGFMQFVNVVRSRVVPPVMAAFRQFVGFLEGTVLPLAETVVRDFVATLKVQFDRIVALVRVIGPPILAVFREVFNALAPIVKPALKLIQSVISTVLAAIRGDWKSVWQNLKGAAKAGLQVLVNIVKGTIPLLWKAAKLLFQKIPEALSEAASKLPGKIGEALTKAKKALQDNWPEIKAAGKKLGDQMVDGIVDAVRAAGPLVASAAKQMMKDAVGNLDVKDYIKGVQGGLGGGGVAGGLGALFRGGNKGNRLGVGGMTSGQISAQESSIGSSAGQHESAQRGIEEQIRREEEARDKAESERNKRRERLAAKQREINAMKGALERTKDKKERARLKREIANAKLERDNIAAAAGKFEASRLEHQANVNNLGASLTQHQTAIDDYNAQLEALANQQQALSDLFTGIAESSELSQAQIAYQEALGNMTGSQAQAARLEALKAELASVQGRYDANWSTMSQSMQAEVIGNMAALQNEINDIQSAAAQAIKDAADAAAAAKQEFLANAAAMMQGRRDRIMDAFESLKTGVDLKEVELAILKAQGKVSDAEAEAKQKALIAEELKAIQTALIQGGRSFSQEMILGLKQQQLALLEEMNRLEESASGSSGTTGTGGAGTIPLGGTVTRLPGSVSGEAGGRVLAGGPLIGSVVVKDPNVDVVNLARRIDWHSRRAGAY